MLCKIVAVSRIACVGTREIDCVVVEDGCAVKFEVCSGGVDEEKVRVDGASMDVGVLAKLLD